MDFESFLKDSSLKFPKDSHSLFSASKYHWLNYSVEKMLEVYSKEDARKMGTELHELAYNLIRLKVKLPETDATLNQYVNDAILYEMIPEKQLYYSEEFRGTADTMTVDVNDILRIHDLKTGTTKASMKQLEIYAALFCLETGCVPSDLKDIELRLYQNNEIQVEHATSETIVPIMDKIVTVDSLIRKMKGRDTEYGYWYSRTSRSST